jgi:hypothetical protein
MPPTMLSSPMQQLEKPRLTEFHLNCSYNGAVYKRTGKLSAENATSIGSGRRNWRQKIAQDRQTAVLDWHELIIRHINSIDCDLETRCNTVDEPLQGVLAKPTTLQGVLDATNAELTATCLQRVALEDHLLHTYEGLAAQTEEKVELERCLDAASKREKRLAQELIDYAKDISDTKDKAALDMNLGLDPQKWLQTQCRLIIMPKSKSYVRVLATEVEKVFRLEMDCDWICTDRYRLQEDLQQAQIHEQTSSRGSNTKRRLLQMSNNK